MFYEHQRQKRQKAINDGYGSAPISDFENLIGIGIICLFLIIGCLGAINTIVFLVKLFVEN